MANLIFPEEGYLFDTHTELQNTFIELIRKHGTAKALDWLKTAKEDKECSYPERLKLWWESDGSKEYTVELSEEGSSSPKVFLTDKNYTEIDNLKIGQSYRWRVNGGLWHRFATKGSSPRFVRIDGVLNVRDIGGIGIKQGMVYRGSALKKSRSREGWGITERGKTTFTEELGIRTDIELRKEKTDFSEVSPAGEGVRRIRLPYRPYAEVFEDEHRAGIRAIMEFLSDESNYPIYVHCLGGADRTGMIALYLRALCGESDDEIHTDYELTALSTYAGGSAEGADGFRSREEDYYVEFLAMLRGGDRDASLSVAVPQFLKSCGVSDECLDRIRGILKK